MFQEGPQALLGDYGRRLTNPYGEYIHCTF
jgi:hypothetical protein